MRSFGIASDSLKSADEFFRRQFGLRLPCQTVRFRYGLKSILQVYLTGIQLSQQRATETLA